MTLRPSRLPPEITIDFNGRAGCPYVHVHHPQFLEWVGAPESARLLSHAPAEWLQVMNRRDTLHAVLQLQRDASLMLSNLTVLHQYAIMLRWMSTEVLHSVFGRGVLPFGEVNDTAPVPHVLWASTHMAAMGLWRPPVGPGGPGLDTRAGNALVVPFVVHGHPVGSFTRSSRTASLNSVYARFC